MKSTLTTLRRMLYLAGIMSVFMLGCGGQIPANYQGRYQDLVNGSRLELNRNDGWMRFDDGRVMRANMQVADFDSIASATAGIYTHEDARDPSLMEIYWIVPRRETREELANLVWYQSEVIYSKIDLRTDHQVSMLFVTYSAQGTVLADRSTEKWQITWPDEALEMQMRRQR